VKGRVHAALDKELELFAEETPNVAPNTAPGDGDGLNDKITRSILDAWHVHLQEGHHHAPTDEATKQMLLDMKSTSMAFVVFDSENAKSAAVDAVKRSGGILVGRENCTLRPVVAEPTEILWDDNGSFILLLASSKEPLPGNSAGLRSLFAVDSASLLALRLLHGLLHVCQWRRAR